MEQLSNRQLVLAQLAMALGGFAIGTGEFVIMALLPDVSAGLQVSITRAGDAITAYALGVVLGAPLIAVVAAQCSRQRLLLALMAIFVLGNLGSGLVQGYWPFLLLRFLSGLPHGAFFGVAALVAASLVPPSLRGKAVGRMMMGLTVATLVGVPVVAFIGHHFSWQVAFWFVAICALLSLIMILCFVPYAPGNATAHPLKELTALTNPQVLMILLTGATGFGGLFAVFSYITPTMLHSSGMSEAMVPWIMVAFGMGMVAGSSIGGRLADWSVTNAIIVSLGWSVLVMILFSWLTDTVITGFIACLLVGTTAVLIPALQIRLMDVAGEAQTLAAAMNHSALNMANALGAWLGGIALDTGLSWTSTSWVGGALALLGLLTYLFSLRIPRQQDIQA